MPDSGADERVAQRFSRVMNATTSPLGILTDPPLVALVTAFFFVAFLAAMSREADAIVVRVLAALAALPFAIAVVATLALLGARRHVVAFLAALPFPLDNMNAILNGVGEVLEVRFSTERPPAVTLNAELDAVSPDSFVMRHEEGEDVIEIRIGVVESKRNPARSNRQRYVRTQDLVTRVLVPLHARFRITEVRVK